MVVSAILGSWCGITGSYLLGLKIGQRLTHKLGRYIGLTNQRILKTHRWFERIGKWSLVIGYFIPGVRHAVGYVAGTFKLPYRDFALFAYLGGLFWSCLFLAIGYFFNDQWSTLLKLLAEKWQMFLVFLQRY
jgi:membrane protein DedA with SNARE-associated domain